MGLERNLVFFPRSFNWKFVKTELIPTELGKIGGGADFLRKIRSSILDTLSLRCLLSRQLDMKVLNLGDTPGLETYIFGILRIQILFQVRRLGEIIKKVSVDTEEKTKDHALGTPKLSWEKNQQKTKKNQSTWEGNQERVVS